MSVYNLGNGAFSQKAIKGGARGIVDGVFDDAPTMQRRLASLVDNVLYDPLDESAGSNRVLRIVERSGMSYDLPNGARILDTVVLLDGDGSWGWQHIRVRHILGTDTSGTGRLTRFPADLDEPTIQRIIAETIANGGVDPYDPSAIVHSFEGRYGINNMRVILYSDGRIKTAYPVDGPKVVVVRAGA